MREYNVIFSSDIDENRQIVLSQDKNTEDFILAQCYIVNENGRKKRLYQKGSIEIKKEYLNKFIANIMAITEIIEQ
jgi:hypothetical protein